MEKNIIRYHTSILFLQEVFLHGHKHKYIVFGHTYIIRLFLKLLIHFIINLFFIIKINILMCVRPKTIYLCLCL